MQQLNALMQDYAPLVKAPVTSAELSDRGVRLQAIGNHDKAMEYFEKAILADPASGLAHFNRAQLLSHQSRHEEALCAYQMAEMLGLRLADLDHNMSMALYWLYQPQEALVYCERALKAATPQTRAMILNSKCLILMDLARPAEAFEAANEAVHLSPGFHLARLNRALAGLTVGKWREGWEDYEVRWHGAHEAQNGTFVRPPIPLPQWQGQKIPPGNGLFVFTEQGLGDTFQFVRYVIAARKRFSQLTLACPAPARQLLEHSLGDAGITFQPLDSVRLEGCHWQCPMLSLPFALRDELPEPYECGPYIMAEKSLTDAWASRLEGLPQHKLNVGLCWAGSSTLRRDAQRSIAFAQISPLLEHADVNWISLQKSDDKAGQYRGTHTNLVDWSEGFTDLSQTAALISLLDLVICVDTSIAHLSAAMGKPVWLLSRFEGEWRWLHNRDDSPWYPTMRLFRQRRLLDWAEVIGRVGKELSAFKPERAPSTQSHA
jgi:tetratricopeptide (TPR) repeat protein